MKLFTMGGNSFVGPFLFKAASLLYTSDNMRDHVLFLVSIQKMKYLKRSEVIKIRLHDFLTSVLTHRSFSLASLLYVVFSILTFVL